LASKGHVKLTGIGDVQVPPRFHRHQPWPVMKLVPVLAMLLTSQGALACDLSLVAPVKSPLNKPVQVQASLADDVLTVSYTVTAPTLNARKVLGPQQFPYMFDVVELFVTFSDSGFPYFEFEVSPFNQTFQVRIPGPGQPFQEGVDLGLMSTAALRPGGWNAELKIPLKPLGWDGDPKKIRGNFYSILERPPKRSFWSSFLPKAAKANFHQPQFFQALLQCG
jgi:hypothetical protein